MKIKLCIDKCQAIIVKDITYDESIESELEKLYSANYIQFN